MKRSLVWIVETVIISAWACWDLMAAIFCAIFLGNKSLRIVGEDEA